MTKKPTQPKKKPTLKLKPLPTTQLKKVVGGIVGLVPYARQ